MLEMLKIIDEWTRYLEKGGQRDAIFIGFEKAFDKVPHRLLISKLNAYKLDQKMISWIEEFLSNRKHRVNINGKYSKWGEVTSGVPQGSVLEPVLFILYINYFPAYCGKNSELYLFADDAKLFRHITCSTDNLTLQSDLHAIKEWTDKSLLKLNYSKCKALSLGMQVCQQ